MIKKIKVFGLLSLVLLLNLFIVPQFCEAAPPNCTITGLVIGPDHLPYKRGNIYLNDVTIQTLAGTTIAPKQWQVQTDANGNIPSGSLVIPQGLQLYINLSGPAFPTELVTIPNTSTGDFATILATNQSPLTPTWVSLDKLAKALGSYDMNGNPLINLPAATTSGQALIYGQTAAGDLSGTYPNPKVTALNNIPLDTTVTPTNNNTWNYNSGTGKWIPTTPLSGPPTGSASGDLSGSYPGPKVVALNNIPLDTAISPSNNYVWAYNSGTGKWTPTSNAALGPAGGDLSGTYPNPTVTAQHFSSGTVPYSVLSGTPSALPPNGSASGDLSGSYPSPTVTGQHFSAGTVPYSVLSGTPSALPPNGSASGDLGSSYPNPKVVGLNNVPLDTTVTLSNNFTWVYNSGTGKWVPQAPISGPPTGSASGDLSGSYPNPTVATVQGGKTPVINTGANTGTGSSFSISNASVNNIVNVKNPAYGAVGDNSHDDTAAIQAALVAACASVVASESIPQVRMPAGVYKVTGPIFDACSNTPIPLKGDGYRATVINQTSNSPTIIVSQGTRVFPSGLNLTVDSNIIPGGSGSSLNYSNTGFAGYFDLNEALGMDNNTSPNSGPFNTLAAFDFRTHIKPSEVTAKHCLWTSDGALNVQAATGPNISLTAPKGIAGFLCQGSDAKLYGCLNIGGTMQCLNSGATTMSNGTEYEVELNYDSATGNENLYLGSGTVNRVAQNTGLSGTITQRPDETNALGGDFPHWPVNGGVSIPWAGNMQSVQFSKVARNTAASYAETTSDYASDANTLFLSNLSLSTFPNNNPGLQVEKPVSAWLSLHDTGDGCCGGDYVLQDFSITGGTLNIFANAANIDMESVAPRISQYIGIETSANATFGSVIKNVPQYEQVGGRLAGAMILGGISMMRDVALPAGVFAGVLGGNSQYYNLFFQTNGGDSCSLVFTLGGTGTTLVQGIQADQENGGNFNSICIQDLGGEMVIANSNFGVPNTADATKYPVELYGSDGAAPGKLTLDHDDIEINTGTVAIVDASLDVSGNATLTPQQAPPNWIVNFVNNSYHIGNQEKDVPASPTQYTTANLMYNVTGNRVQNTMQESPMIPRAYPSGSSVTCFSSPCTITLPSNLEAGKLLAFAGNTGSTAGATITMPAGWTAGCTYDDHAASSSFWHTFYHVITADDVNATSISVSYSAGMRASLMQISGVNSLTPQGSCFGVHGASSTSYALTGGTGTDTAGNSLIIDYVQDQNGRAGTPSGSLPNAFTQVGLSGFGYTYLPRSSTIPTINFTANTCCGAVTWGGVQVEYLPEITTTALQPYNYGAAPTWYGESAPLFGSMVLNPTLFANLGTPSNGIMKYCSDCNIANPCTSGGNGAMAKRLNSAWVCN